MGRGFPRVAQLARLGASAAGVLTGPSRRLAALAIGGTGAAPCGAFGFGAVRFAWRAAAASLVAAADNDAVLASGTMVAARDGGALAAARRSREWRRILQPAL